MPPLAMAGALFPVFFYISLLLSRPYLYGDQVFYRNLYETLGKSSFTDVFFLQLMHTGSSEPFYGILVWIGATLGIDKDIYISLFNAALMSLTVIYCMKNRASFVFIGLLLCSYYMVVLMVSAERLKFSYIFIVAALLLTSKLLSFSVLFLSPLAHFQSIILLAARGVGFVSNISFSRFVRPRNLAFFIAGIFALPVVMFTFFSRFSGAIQEKTSAYSSSSGGLSEVSSLLVLAVTAIIVLPRRFETCLIFVACAAAVVAVGADRVNMIGVSLFVYLAVRDQKTRHPLTISLMAYFSYKSIDFIQRIMTNGTGY